MTSLGHPLTVRAIVAPDDAIDAMEDSVASHAIVKTFVHFESICISICTCCQDHALDRLDVTNGPEDATPPFEALGKKERTMKVKDIMTTPVATCGPEANLAEATALMWDNDCGILPVVGEAGGLAGVVTDRDICVALGTRNVRSSDLCVRDVLKDHILVCKSSDDINTALQTMREGKIRRLPVVNEDALLEGIVSMDDVVLNAQHGDGKTGYGVSHGEVVATLKAIYTHDDRMRSRSAVA